MSNKPTATNSPQYMLLKLYQTGQPVLRQQAKPMTHRMLATSHTQAVIDHMIATLRDAPGVGLAAPQVGESSQIIVIEDKAVYHEQVPPALLHEQGRVPIPLTVLVNPKLEIVQVDPALFFEGCLSVEGYVAVVPRATAVKVEAWDRLGNPLSYVAHGWHARILQHELDHLHGTLLLDRMYTRSFMSIKNFNVLWRKELSGKIQEAFRD